MFYGFNRPACSVSWDAILSPGLDVAPCFFLGLNHWIGTPCSAHGILGFVWILVTLWCPHCPVRPELYLLFILTSWIEQAHRGAGSSQGCQQCVPRVTSGLSAVCPQSHLRPSLTVHSVPILSHPLSSDSVDNGRVILLTFTWIKIS